MSSISPNDFSENLSEFLCEEHLRDLRTSGLSDETIFAEGFQTVDDINLVASELRWSSCRRLQFMGPFLRIPYRKADGSLMEYCRYKPSNPRTRARDDGTEQVVKYEAPREKSPPPYYPAGMIESLNMPRAPLYVTEGEKKAAKATQEGFPSIGLPGVSNWSKKRKENQYGKKTGRRRLNKWLRRIDWQDREVFIVFDTDERRNPDVNREAAELARALERHGAVVHILTLPAYWNETIGEYEKQGLDDFLMRCGSEAFQRLIFEQTSMSTSVGLGDYRLEMQSRRTQITEPGLYLDTSPPGTGKSHLDVQVDLQGGKMLILVPTHAQCDAAVAQFTVIDKEVAKYPQRSNENCGYYRNIKRIESLGLDASGIVCPKCPGRGDCAYHAACREAKRASIVIATHERFHRDGEKLTRDRRYISVHEDLINILARTIEASNFDQVVALGQWGAYTEKNYSEAAGQLQTVAGHCRDALLQFNETVELVLPDFGEPVEKVNLHLNHLVDEAVELARYLPRSDFPDILRQPFNGTAFQLCRMILAGHINRLHVRHSCHENGYVEKMLVGIQRVSFPSDSIVILNDGTATLESVPPEFRDRIRDITPPGRVEQLQEIVQYPVDVTKSDSSLLRLVNSIRAIMRLHPDRRGIGLITHKRFIEETDGRSPFRDLLTADENERLIKVDWFRGTESRGSNSWKEECDLLIVAGTPRVPASAVQNRLLQLGNVAAAARNGQWASLDYWSGRRLDGKRETVRSRTYRDHDWHEAARQIVHAELVQAIGRARPVCSDGIPLTIVLSTEPLDFPLADEKLEVINKRIAQNAVLAIYHLLDCVGALNSGNERERIPNGELCSNTAEDHPRGESCPDSRDCLLDGDTLERSANFAYRLLKQNWPIFSSDADGRICPTIKTGNLFPRIGINSERNARRIFEELERFGLLSRDGKKGRYLTINNLRLFDQLPPYLFGCEPEVSHTPDRLLAGSLAMTTAEREAVRLACMNALRGCTPRLLRRLGRPMTVADTAPYCTDEW